MRKLYGFLIAGLAAMTLFGCTSKDAAVETGGAAGDVTDVSAGAPDGTGVTDAAGDTSWPTGTMTIFVPAQAGSNMDIKARIVSKYLGASLGQSVVVENRPGAGGITAATQFLVEKPNSNNIEYLSASSLAVSPIYNDVEYTAGDFAIVAGLDTVENGLFVNPALGIKSLDELKEYGRDKIVKFSSAGVGNDSFLTSKVLMETLGLKSDNISGDGFPESIINVMSGNADVCYSALNIAEQYVQEGSLIPLCVYSEEDYSGYKDYGYETVPSLKSLGYDISYSTITWFALRGGTDPQNVKKLETTLNEIYKNEDFLSEMEAAGFVMMEDTSSARVQEIADEMIIQCQEFADMIGQ